MTSIKITRRQFLKWLSASAAALGLSQTDLLKVKEAMAVWPGPVTPNFPIAPLGRVIWIAGAACSGCPTSLLNYIADTADPDPVLNAIANNALGLWSDIESLYPVSNPGANFGPDLLPLTPDDVGDGHIDIAEVVLEIITIDYAQIVMATSGDVPNNYLLSLLADPLYKYVLLVEGTIQTKAQGKFCRIMDLPGQLPPGIYDTAPNGPYVHRYNDPDLGWRTDVTMAGGTLWLADNPNCLAVVTLGTCAAYGGVPAAKKSVTGGMGAYEWLNCVNGLGKLILNIPGCPPNSDWVIASVGAALLELNGVIPGILFNNLDTTPCQTVTGTNNVPRNTYTGIYHSDPNYVFCQDDPRVQTQTLPGTTLLACQRSAAQPIGRCLMACGCNGYILAPSGSAHLKPDCPTRMWNPIETPGGLVKNNWCVLNNSPCNGCASPGFPDYCSPFYEVTKGSWKGYSYKRPLKPC
jgi:hydrogenase small subunit